MKQVVRSMFVVMLSFFASCGSDTDPDEAAGSAPSGSASETGNAYTDSLKSQRDAATTAAEALEEAARERAEAAAAER